MNTEKKIQSVRRRHDEDETQGSLNSEDFLLWVVENQERRISYLRDRLEVERLDRDEAVRRRAMLFPTALAFEREE